MAYHSYSYGSFTLPFSRLSVAEEIVYADNGITQSATRYTFTISGVLAAATQSAFQSLIYQMRCQLQAPRKPLVISWSTDNITFTPIYSYDATTDIDFGPKPDNLNIDQFSGGLSGTYSFRVTVTAKDCFQSCNPSSIPTSANNILSLSRNYTHSIDENGFTTRTISGILTVGSSTASANGLPADSWRAFVTPAVPTNFRRVNQTFTQSANGLQLQYTITDKEQLWSFPTPVTSGRASFTIHQQNLGSQCTYTLHGTFATTKSHNKVELYAFIINLMMNRFPNGGLQGGTPVFIWLSRSITESVFENEVSFNFSGWSAAWGGDSNNPNDTTWLIGFGGYPNGTGNTGKNTAIAPYGADAGSLTGGSGVQAAYPEIYDGCVGGLLPSGNGIVISSPTNTGALYVNNPPGSGAVMLASNLSQGSTSGLSQAHLMAPFVSIHETLSFEGNNYIRMFPSKVAGKPALIQQTANPTVTLIQAGYITRDDPTGNNPPTAPAPFYGMTSQGSQQQQPTGGAYVDKWYVSLPVSQPLATVGQIRWSIQYRYVIVLPGPVNHISDLNINFPQDPRLTATPKAPTLPELVVTSI